MKLGKKLKPARRVWKGFTSKLQSKLLKLKPSKALKNTTLCRLNTTVLSLLGRPHHCSSRLRRKNQPSTRPLAALRTHHHRRRSQILSNFDIPACIDDLLNEPGSVRVKSIEPQVTGEKGAPSGTRINEPGPVTLVPCDEPIKDMELPMSKVEAVGDKGSLSVGEPELMSEVDERAERFIAEFRREMRLQRQRSFREYQEMLQRGVM